MLWQLKRDGVYQTGSARQARRASDGLQRLGWIASQAAIRWHETLGPSMLGGTSAALQSGLEVTPRQQRSTGAWKSSQWSEMH